MSNFAFMSGTGNDFIVGKYAGEVSEIQIIALVSDAEIDVDGVIFVEKTKDFITTSKTKNFFSFRKTSSRWSYNNSHNSDCYHSSNVYLCSG